MRNRSLLLVMVLGISVGLAATSACRKKEPAAASEPSSPSREVAAKPADTAPELIAPSAEEPVKPGQTAPPPEPVATTPPPAEQPATPPEVVPAAPDPPAAVTRSLASIERELLATWDGIQSFAANITTKADRQGPAAADHLIGQGVYECKKKDGKLLARFEVVNRIVREDEVAELMSDERKVVTVLDGESLCMYTEGGGMPSARRYAAKSDQLIQLGGQYLFRQLHELNELEVLPDETIDGRTVYVVGGTPKDTGGKTTYYFDQQTGIMVKLFMEHKPSNSSRSITISDIKINPELDDERFTFTVPEGVPIIEPAPVGVPTKKIEGKAVQPG